MPCSPQIQKVFAAIEQEKINAIASFACAVMNSVKAQNFNRRGCLGAVRAERAAAKRLLKVVLGVKHPTDYEIDYIIPG